MKASELLRAAGDLLEQPGAWTQGFYARDAKFQQVPPENENAVCWCALGAIEKIGGFGSEFGPAARFIRKAIRFGYREAYTVVEWNDVDDRTQIEVVNVFRKAEQLALEDCQ